MNCNQDNSRDPEDILLPVPAAPNSKNRFGKSFKHFDPKHLRHVGVENLPGEVRLGPAFDSETQVTNGGWCVLSFFLL